MLARQIYASCLRTIQCFDENFERTSALRRPKVDKAIGEYGRLLQNMMTFFCQYDCQNVLFLEKIFKETSFERFASA